MNVDDVFDAVWKLTPQNGDLLVIRLSSVPSAANAATLAESMAACLDRLSLSGVGVVMLPPGMGLEQITEQQLDELGLAWVNTDREVEPCD